MKKLREITKIVISKRLKKIELFEENEIRDEKSKLNDLYNGIKKDSFESDKDAARALYNSSPLSTKFRQLKFRYKNRINNTLFFLDVKNTEFSKYHKAYYTCNKNWSLIRILLSNGARDSAKELLDKTYKLAFTYKLHDICYFCARDLQNHYSLVGNTKKFEEYILLTKHHEKLLGAENKSNELYQKTIIKFTGTVAKQPELAPKIRGYLSELKTLANEYKDSYIIQYNRFIVWALICEIEFKFKEALAIYEQTEGYIKSHPPFHQKIRLAEIALKKMVCYLHMRDYEHGEENAKKCKNLFRQGSNNWFIFYEYYFLLAMHTGNYRTALERFREIHKHDRSKYLTPGQKEKWKIFEAYLFYALKSQGVRSTNFKTKSRFNIYKFVNEVPIYTRDKTGYNIAIFIVQVLIFLEAKNFDAIIILAEALRVYRSRYLKDTKHFRSNCFIKMLLIMEKESFDFSKTNNKTTNLFTKLKMQSVDQMNISEIEVIPYEILWEQIIKRLKVLDEESNFSA